MGPNDPFERTQKKPSISNEEPRETSASTNLLGRFSSQSIGPVAGAIFGIVIGIAWVYGAMGEALIVLLFGLAGAMLGAAATYLVRRPDRLVSAWNVLRGNST